jgi:hypothetical protein
MIVDEIFSEFMISWMGNTYGPGALFPTIASKTHGQEGYGYCLKTKTYIRK